MIKYYRCLALLGALGFTNTVHANNVIDGCPQNIRIADLINIIETAEPIPQKFPEHAPDHFKVNWKGMDWVIESTFLLGLKIRLKDDKFLLGNRLWRSSIKSFFNDGTNNVDGIRREKLECYYDIYNYTYGGRDEYEHSVGRFVMITELQPVIKPSTSGAHIWK